MSRHRRRAARPASTVSRRCFAIALAALAALAAANPAAAQPQEPAPAAPPVALEVTTLTDTLPGGVGGVAVDRLGDVYVADFGETVWKIDPFGAVEVFATGLYGASGNAVDGEGNLLQSSFFAGTLSRIARDGTVTTVARGLAGPVGVAVDDEGVITVCNCNGNSLSRIAPGGEVETFAESDLLNCPNGITRGPDGTLYVANFSDGRVLAVSAGGEVTELAALPSPGNGHLVWAAGELYVTAFRANKLFRVSPEGDFAAVAGSGAFAATDGAGAAAAFANPNGIAYDPTRDVLYINDYLTPFLQRNLEPRRSVLRRVAFPNLTQRLTTALADGGTAAAEAAYRAYKDSRPGRFTEIELNILGYQLLGRGEIDQALALFTWNTEDYPASANTWDSLAEAWAAKGDRDRAVRHYRKSLELNPGNVNAVQKLQELGAE